MKQILFVLLDEKISQWYISRGKLAVVTICGQHKVDYSAETAKSYWDEWKEDHQVPLDGEGNIKGEPYDAIFLSDSTSDFGVLPKWICANSRSKSAWTFEQLSLLAEEEDYAKKGLCFVQGNVKRLVGTEKIADAIQMCLMSSLAFTLPKEDAKQTIPDTNEPKKSVTAENTSNTDVQREVSSNVFIGDSYNDTKAMLLKVGDKINCTVASIRSARGFCYLESDKTSDLVRVKLAPIEKALEARASIFNVGTKLQAEVTAVKDKIVEFKIHL